MKRQPKFFIIGCSARKKPGYLPAFFKYDGPLWQTFRKYATEDDVAFALSAKYGLIESYKRIGDYDCLLGRDVSDKELCRKVRRSLYPSPEYWDLMNPYVLTSKRYAQVLSDAGISRFRFVEGGIGVKRKKLRQLLTK